MNLKRDRANRGQWWNLKRRKWAYGIAVAAVPVAASYGWITDNQAAPMLALAAAVLGTTGLALTHPTEDQP